MKNLDKYADPNCEKCEGTGEIELDPRGPWEEAQVDYCDCVVKNIEREEEKLNEMENTTFSLIEFIKVIEQARESLDGLDKENQK